MKTAGIARRSASLLALLLALAGCARPVPADRSAYVGEWRERSMYLLITADGSVRYRRLKGGVTTSIDAPLRRFAGDDFIVGVGPFRTTFVVSQPPHQEGGAWIMVVDDVRLTRTAE
jgi:hypothetical protein